VDGFEALEVYGAHWLVRLIPGDAELVEDLGKVGLKGVLAGSFISLVHLLIRLQYLQTTPILFGREWLLESDTKEKVSFFHLHRRLLYTYGDILDLE
jgi:hypothetical protein